MTRRATRKLRVRIRSTLFHLPAWFAPTSDLRVAFHRLRGVDVAKDAEIGYSVIIDNFFPERVHIGHGATVAARSTILAHDEARHYTGTGAEVVRDTWIGENAFIGVHAVVMPGVRVGARAIVGAGSVVTKDVPPDAIVVGVPARQP